MTSDLTELKVRKWGEGWVCVCVGGSLCPLPLPHPHPTPQPEEQTPIPPGQVPGSIPGGIRSWALVSYISYSLIFQPMRPFGLVQCGKRACELAIDKLSFNSAISRGHNFNNNIGVFFFPHWGKCPDWRADLLYKVSVVYSRLLSSYWYNVCLPALCIYSVCGAGVSLILWFAVCSVTTNVGLWRMCWIRGSSQLAGWPLKAG